MGKLTEKEARTAGRLLASLDAFRKEYSEFPLQQMLLLLTIAQAGETTLSDVAKQLDIAQSTASRLIISLGERPTRGGLTGQWGFITTKADPEDDRRKLITLTIKGHNFVQKVLSYL
jgi:DNA-binding MarR family transcriptional regulator